MRRYEITHPNGDIHVWETASDPQTAILEWVDALHDDAYCYPEDCEIKLAENQDFSDPPPPPEPPKWRKRKREGKKEFPQRMPQRPENLL